MRCKALCLICLIFSLAVAGLPALAGPAIPEVLQAEFSQYPGSNLVAATDSSVIKQAILSCGDVPRRAVYEYYRAKVVGGGWQIRAERKVHSQWNLMVSKGTRWNGNISVVAENGKTTVTLTVMGMRQG